MYEQLDIFSLMKSQIEEPEILLSSGQKVFLVNKADVIKCVVCNDETSWICGENNRGYRLIKENGGYDVTWNDRILGKEAFTDYKSARNKADEFKKTHDGIILASDIEPASIVAYSYIRNCDNREMFSFYCDLGNDMYYVKEFMTYHHIIKGKEAIKKFTRQQEVNNNNSKQIDDFVPNFKNMYKCTVQSDWDYAECEYTYAVG